MPKVRIMKIQLIIILLFFSSMLYSQEIYTSTTDSFTSEIDWARTPKNIFILENKNNFIFDSMKGRILASAYIDVDGKITYTGIFKLEISDSINIIKYTNYSIQKLNPPGYIKYFDDLIRTRINNIFMKITNIKSREKVLHTTTFLFEIK